MGFYGPPNLGIMELARYRLNVEVFGLEGASNQSKAWGMAVSAI
jgi:hypothetical protein